MALCSFAALLLAAAFVPADAGMTRLHSLRRDGRDELLADDAPADDDLPHVSAAMIAKGASNSSVPQVVVLPDAQDEKAADASLNVLGKQVMKLATSKGDAAKKPATAKVDLGTAANYVVLTKTGISTVPSSSITGNIGVSPIAGTAMTGFSFTADSSDDDLPHVSAAMIAKGASNSSVPQVMKLATSKGDAAKKPATAKVDLGTAANYVVLTKTGISTVPSSSITGNIGVSPIAGTAMTGFSFTAHESKECSTSSQITGCAYAPTDSPPTPAKLTTAVSDMERAYTDAAGRANTKGHNLGGGNIGGLTLTTGVYTFTTAILINTDVTFSGGADDVFILQTTGKLTQAASTKVILVGGAQAKNIFWQLADTVSVGASAVMQGILLAKTNVVFVTSSSLTGRVLAQTECALQKGGASAVMQGILLAKTNVVFVTSSSLAGGRVLAQTECALQKATITQPVDDVGKKNDPEASGVVDLGTAVNYVILTKTGISTVATSSIRGNIGVSPAPGTSMIGFSFTADASKEFSKSSQVTGFAYAPTDSPPTPAKLITAVSDMETAYTAASKRTDTQGTPLTGKVGGLILIAGVYKFHTAIIIDADITFHGGADDVFILQTTGSLMQAASTNVILAGGALAKNIFWQVEDIVSVGASAVMQGILLAKKKVVFMTSSSLKGRIFSQTEVALQMATITWPGDGEGDKDDK
eukprot:CAMPEP_0204245654 /NCGR_PEP_ID=MMETSP0361-20130328/97739_1 /ASSEMBLY_ACC=CAM_ASM_000343 /TAXON_ID=268821 /ORGANISM="Scrippsiella Hangoei, Strain SHTV-5" /LENGTH=699 /DNA_ID=CAMNT_0051218859 /DNA_START=53 /DNA_END=2153 /DNA_ORIENTATION=+